ADQRLRKPLDPLDPSNRRVSLIVQYTPKDADQEPAKPAVAPEEKKADGATPPKPSAGTEKPIEKALPIEPGKKETGKKEPAKK
ncbi:MAG: hypothetical protein WAU50_18680, partial [Candidatus Sulfotelmatobacter sp.]